MKKILYKTFAICLLAMAIVGCDNKDVLDALAKPVPLQMKLSSQSLVMGEELTIEIFVDDVKNPDLVANEDFDIYFTALSGVEDVADKAFETFPKMVTFKKGENKIEVKVPIKQKGITSNISLDLTAFSRGYKVKGATQSVIIGDYHYTILMLKNNVDKVVKEGESFIIMASIAIPAKEDIVIQIQPTEGEADVYENMPKSLTIATGKTSVESSDILIKKDGIYTGDRALTLLLSAQSIKHPLLAEKMTITMKDIDAPLGSILEDERWVYENPSIPLMSVKNKEAILDWYNSELHEIKMGDAHPKLSNWKFYNSLEFHFIPRSFSGGNAQPNQFGNYTPWCFSAQNTAAVQKEQGVNNQKYSTITEEGYLKMWSVKESTQATGGGTGLKPYGTSAFYSSKFSENNGANVTYAPQHTRIYPGMRIEVRARVRGAKKGFNAAIWLQGIAQNKLPWPKYGEIDIFENPAGPSEGMNAAYQTFHMGEDDTQDFNPHKKVTLSKMNEWNIYWVELVDENTIHLGINGQRNVTATRSSLPDPSVWPFDKTMNPEGLYFILTLAAPSPWSLGSVIPIDWDSGFAGISYSESKTHNNTPRMEIDWVRFYTNEIFDIGDRKSAYTHNNFYFY